MLAMNYITHLSERLLMEDIKQSLKRLLVKDGWMSGDKLHRIGHPFEWVCGDQHLMWYEYDGIVAMQQYLAGYYEEYPTPDSIKCSNYDEVLTYTEQVMRNCCKHFMPFLSLEKLESYIKCTALVRTQDYSFIKTQCRDLPAMGLHHVDMGPGLGSHAIYSLRFFDSHYHGVEAIPYSYAAQRHFFRFLSPEPGAYFDLVEGENFGIMSDGEQKAQITRQEYRIRHVPSWKYQLLPDKSMDLVTGTWMLNEVSTSGIIWLLSNAMRVLKEGGYFYIRDSRLLKPKRHQLSYDDILEVLGFEKVIELDVTNRVNYFGVPRVYQKTEHIAPSFDELHERFVGKFGITIHGGEYNQHLKAMKVE